MKRSELKKLIKPLVKECVQETILNDGLLSNIVSEVAQGMGNQFAHAFVAKELAVYQPQRNGEAANENVNGHEQGGHHTSCREHAPPKGL